MTGISRTEPAISPASRETMVIRVIVFEVFIKSLSWQKNEEKNPLVPHIEETS